MIHEDFYSGNPVEQPNNQENEAAQMASFGAAHYDFDPAARMMQQQQVITPGGNGFYANSPPQQGLGSPMRYNQYGDPMPTFNQFRSGGQYGYSGNPLLQSGMQQQPIDDRPNTIVIPGINNNGEYLPPMNYQEKIEDMQREYWAKYQEQQAENAVKQQNTMMYGGYGFNYYGTPYYNPYQYNSLNSEINRDVERIKDEARQARFDLNMQISQLAHNVVSDNVNMDVIRERYEGRVIELPEQTMGTLADLQQMAQLDRMVEVSNAEYYQRQYAAASKAINDAIPKDADLNECFKNIGVVVEAWNMEDELHRRKDYTSTYNSSDGTYRYFVRKKAEERYAKENGIDLPHLSQRFDPQQAQQSALNGFPTLKESVTLSPDGTLNVTCNVGSHAGQVYSVNENESEYQERKERFDRFLSSIPGSIYKNNNG